MGSLFNFRHHARPTRPPRVKFGVGIEQDDLEGQQHNYGRDTQAWADNRANDAQRATDNVGNDVQNAADQAGNWVQDRANDVDRKLD